MNIGTRKIAPWKIALHPNPNPDPNPNPGKNLLGDNLAGGNFPATEKITSFLFLWINFHVALNGLTNEKVQ